MHAQARKVAPPPGRHWDPAVARGKRSQWEANLPAGHPYKVRGSATADTCRKYPKEAYHVLEKKLMFCKTTCFWGC